MKFTNTLKFLLIILGLSMNVLAQNKGQTIESKQIKKQVYLSKEKPSVYISYERVGKLKPLGAFEGDNRVWLRLHNNTRWSLSLAAGAVPKDYGDTSLYYDIDRIKENRIGSEEPYKQNLPTGELLGDALSIIQLPSGKSLLFSIPKEHIAVGLVIKIRFAYEWENENSVFTRNEPRHYVYFFSTDLPTDIAQP